MMQAVTGVFRSQDDAERAVSQLRNLGIAEKRIGIVRPGSAPGRLEAGVPITDTEDPDRDEESYRLGYQAALHPKRRGKTYSDVESDLISAYTGSVLDRPFQAGYERGQGYRPRGVENR